MTAQDKNAPKRGMSAYFFFMNAKREQIKEENPGINFLDIGKKSAEMWKVLEDKSEWEEKAKQDKVRYEKEKAEYDEKMKVRNNNNGGGK